MHTILQRLRESSKEHVQGHSRLDEDWGRIEMKVFKSCCKKKVKQGKVNIGKKGEVRQSDKRVITNIRIMNMSPWVHPVHLNYTINSG